MTSINRLTVGIAVLLTAGCALGTPSIPAPSGPSVMSLSIVLTASPDRMARDGSAKSTITVTARDANGQPVRNLSLRLDLKVSGTPGDLGTLSARTVSTGNDGSAAVIYTAPLPAAFGAPNDAAVQIVATPVGTNTDGANAASSAVTIHLVTIGVIQAPSTLPVASFFVSPTAPYERQPVLFDASASHSSGGGKILTYTWNFGDGGTTSGASPTVMYHYDLAAAYQVTLTVTDDRGLSGTSAPMALTVAAAANPVASFVFSPTAPQLSVAGSTDVFFNGSASSVPTGRTIVNWQWDFGDGKPLETNSVATTKHTYTVAKTYIVVLTVTDDIGRTGTTTVPVSVAPATNPVASFVFSPTNAVAPETIYFDGSASAAATGRQIVSWQWNYGDGTPLDLRTSPITNHPYSVARTYTVTLVVTDDLGRTGTTSVTVTLK